MPVNIYLILCFSSLGRIAKSVPMDSTPATITALADRHLVHRATGHLCHNQSKSSFEHRLSNMDAGVSTILHSSDTSLHFSPD